MAYCKLNTLHWHMVDDQSFPVESTALPNLAGLGAYSPAHTYSHADLREVVAYARARGIAVLPEFDIPGHSSSWQIGYGRGRPVLMHLRLWFDAQLALADRV